MDIPVIDTLPKTDTFNVQAVQNLLIAAKQKEKLDSLLQICNQNISSYELAVRELQDKDSVNKEIVITYKAMIETMKEQRKVLEDQITTLNKEIKKWKRKNRLTAIAGVLTTIGGVVTTVLLLK